LANALFRPDNSNPEDTGRGIMTAYANLFCRKHLHLEKESAENNADAV
jgi:hypothetical protein